MVETVNISEGMNTACLNLAKKKIQVWCDLET